MPDHTPFDATITSIDELRTIYRTPSPIAAVKERPTLDAASREFIERCRFAVVGTFDADGNPDVSPRGGASGFVQVLDETRMAIADLSGNNRLDTLQNIVATGRIALVFVVPGKTETVRVNGRAWVTTDPAVLEGFTLPKRPKAAIGVAIETTFMHCGKAFMRSAMWEPAAWAELADVPDGAAVLTCQQVVDADDASVRAALDDSYARDLAAEA
jgi:uncharacterized protein